jgi:hypothetical protein
MSSFSLNEYSRMRVKKVVYQAADKTRDTSLDLSFGKARFIAAKLTEKSKFEVTTPTAVAGVRGSDFALLVQPESPEASTLSRFFAWLNPVGIAHAQGLGVLATTIVTGSQTTVSFAGLVGAPQAIGAFSTSVAAAGASASAATFVGAAAAGAALNSVGPGMAFMSMPDYMMKKR